MPQTKTPTKFQKARAVVNLQGIKVNKTDSKGRIKDAFVNGSHAKIYNVILKRTDDNRLAIAECLLQTVAGNVDCKSAYYGLCYHALATVIESAERQGKKIAFCANEEDAKRRVNLGGEIFKLVSERNLEWCMENNADVNAVWVVVIDK